LESTLLKAGRKTEDAMPGMLAVMASSPVRQTGNPAMTDAQHEAKCRRLIALKNRIRETLDHNERTELRRKKNLRDY
jgi:hypothetical protein